jgi:hypothetical protein
MLRAMPRLAWNPEPAQPEEGIADDQPGDTVTEYHEFPGRSHWTCGGPGWEEVADYALDWAVEPEQPPRRMMSSSSLATAGAVTTSATAATRAARARGASVRMSCSFIRCSLAPTLWTRRSGMTLARGGIRQGAPRIRKAQRAAAAASASLKTSDA